MTKTSGKKLNLLKSLEILQSNPFISFYHFNNLSKKEWDEIKLKLREICALQPLAKVTWNPEGLSDKTCRKGEGSSTQTVERDYTAPFLGNPWSPCFGNQENQGLPRKGESTLSKGLHLLNKGFFVEAASLGLFPRETNKRKHKGIRVNVLVMKSKAVVKVLRPLLSATNNQEIIEENTHSTLGFLGFRGKKPKGSFTTPFANPGEKLLSVPRVPVRSKDEPLPRTHLGIASQEQETAFKDRTTSLKRALSLIEGPTLLIGTSTIEGFKESARRLEKEKQVVFVGGVLESQFINHLDLKACLNLNLLRPAHLVQTLKLSLIVTPLAFYSNKLLFLLQKRQESLKSC